MERGVRVVATGESGEGDDGVMEAVGEVEAEEKAA